MVGKWSVVLGSAFALAACGTYEAPSSASRAAAPATAADEAPASDDAVAAATTEVAPPSTTVPAEGPASETGQDPAGDPAGAASGNQDEPKAPVNASGGSGGGLGLVEQTFTASNGLTSSYKINAPADSGPAKAYGLHIHVHGDGGGGYVDFPNKETKNDLIGVTVKAPNRTLTWGRAAGKPHGVYLQELIQNELLKKYNIDLSRIYFSGVSGGSYFMTGNFIPSYGHFYRSGAFLMCGGEEPRVAFAEPAFLKDFRIHFQETAAERIDILPSVKKSIAAYKTALAAAGGDAAKQTSEIVGPGGHCEFDDVSYTTGIQFMMDKSFATILK